MGSQTCDLRGSGGPKIRLCPCFCSISLVFEPYSAVQEQITTETAFIHHYLTLSSRRTPPLTYLYVLYVGIFMVYGNTSQPGKQKGKASRPSNVNPFLGLLDDARAAYFKGKPEDKKKWEVYDVLLKLWKEWNATNLVTPTDTCLPTSLHPHTPVEDLPSNASEQQSYEETDETASNIFAEAHPEGRTLTSEFRLTSYGDVSVTTPLAMFFRPMAPL